MTLQQLKYIIAITECGSISSAAQNLLVAQPSLSKSVSELEKEMGITIFYRNNRGVFLSDDGSKFLSYARQV
ncbi:MAG: LysR family transcriptional regulator, partial [Eubacterium sp.]